MQLALATWQEVEEYLQSSRGCIIPIGSVEQHGPNGLIGTDHLDAEFVAKGVGDATGCMVAPTLAYGMSQHHLAFAGSATLRPSTLMLVVRDVVLSLALHGFERFFFINGHGGNVATVTAAFDEIYAETSLGADRPAIKCRMTFWSAGPRGQKLAQELYGDSNGNHATASEVSLSQYYQPGSIKQAQLHPKVAPKSGGFFEAADYRRRFPDGRIGSDPSLSTPEHGKLLFEAAVADMTEAVSGVPGILGFLLRRLGLVCITFLGVTFLAFALVHLLPGDPVAMMFTENVIDPERHAALMAQLGLDRPLPAQYLAYIGRVLHGDLGRSLATHESVLSEFLTLFPATVELALSAMLLAILIGLPLGIIAAVRRGTGVDYGVMGLALAGYSMPIFWWAILLILLFSVTLGITPVSSRIDVAYYIEPTTGFMLIDSWLSDEPGAFRSALSHLVLPAIALGTIPLAIIARMTRSAMLEVLGDDYVRTARAKGLAPGRVVGLHALRNALIPVITVIGLQVGTLFGGAVLTETIFAWPGVGKWLIQSVGRRDYPVLQGGMLLIACIIITVNLAVDVLTGLVNPRIRHAG